MFDFFQTSKTKMRCRKIQCAYGTVTGKAQSIAEQIHNELVSKKFEVCLYIIISLTTQKYDLKD
jgi:flavodoxin